MLSGTLELNGIKFGEWTATNTDHRNREYADYWCTLWYRGTDGVVYTADWMIYHVWRHNGAVSLAARILTDGIYRARKRVPHYERDDN